MPGLDVIQCCYCAHWSFTNPLLFKDAGELYDPPDAAHGRNVLGDFKELLALNEPKTPALSEGGGEEQQPSTSTPVVLEDGDAAAGSQADGATPIPMDMSPTKSAMEEVEAAEADADAYEAEEAGGT